VTEKSFCGRELKVEFDQEEDVEKKAAEAEKSTGSLRHHFIS